MQVLAIIVGLIFTAVTMALRIPYSTGLTADEATARSPDAPLSVG